MQMTKIAIIGCGKQAPKHISGLKKIPGVEIVLTDIDLTHAQELAEKESLSWLANSDEVFADDSFDAVDICTPTPSHVPLIKSALASGKDFLCEKPLVDNIKDAKNLLELMENSDRIGMVGYIYRFAPIFELGHSLFKHVPKGKESLELGKIVSAQFRLGGRGSHQLWKHKIETGGGAINEMLVHMVDLAIWYFGEVESVQVLACDLMRPTRQVQGVEQTVDAEDYVIVRLKMSSGVTVVCQADLLTPSFIQFAEVQGESGTFFGSIQSHLPSYLYVENDIAGYQKGRNDFNFGQHNLFEAQMADFVNAVRSREQPSRSTIYDSLLLMQAMELVRKELKL